MATYPAAPSDFTPSQRRAWNSLIEVLEARDKIYHKGLIGDDYVVSGAVTVSTAIDLASVTVTATTQTVAKLLKDLKNFGVLDMSNPL